MKGYKGDVFLGRSAPDLFKTGFLAAYAAKMRIFLVNVFHIGARTHHTGRIVAMDQSESVTEFMDDFLDSPFE